MIWFDCKSCNKTLSRAESSAGALVAPSGVEAVASLVVSSDTLTVTTFRPNVRSVAMVPQSRGRRNRPGRAVAHPGSGYMLRRTRREDAVDGREHR